MRNHDRFAALALAAALCLAASTAAHAQRRTTRDSTRGAPPADVEQADGDDYSILETRNIFLRDRSVPRQRVQTPAAPRPAPPRPERDIVLTGVVRRDGEYVAFFENRRTGETSRLQVGDPLLQGRIAGIALDHVMYETDSRSAQVGLGMDLDGAASSAAASATAPTPASTAGAGTPAAPSATPEDRASVLERLRQRRQQEMNR